MFRVADAIWEDPLDKAYRARRGGRWNAPGSFGVLYLNSDLEAARDYVRSKHADRAYRVEDLSNPPILVTVNVDREEYVDAVSGEGLVSLGLPSCYPRAEPDRDALVAWSICQPLGAAMYDAGEAGVACRSANTADGRGRELAWFEQPGRGKPAIVSRRDFDDWYWSKTVNLTVTDGAGQRTP